MTQALITSETFNSMKEAYENNMSTDRIEEIASGFESFDSFFTGLGMEKEKDCIKHYEQYLQNYFRTTLKELEAEAGRRVEEALKEAGNFVGELYDTGNMGDNEFSLLKEFFDEKLQTLTK